MYSEPAGAASDPSGSSDPLLTVSDPPLGAIAPEKLAVEAARMLQERPMGGRLVVVDPQGRLAGALTFHDLLAEGVV